MSDHSSCKTWEGVASKAKQRQMKPRPYYVIDIYDILFAISCLKNHVSVNQYTLDGGYSKVLAGN